MLKIEISNVSILNMKFITPCPGPPKIDTNFSTHVKNWPIRYPAIQFQPIFSPIESKTTATWPKQKSTHDSKRPQNNLSPNTQRQRPTCIGTISERETPFKRAQRPTSDLLSWMHSSSSSPSNLHPEHRECCGKPRWVVKPERMGRKIARNCREKVSPRAQVRFAPGPPSFPGLWEFMYALP